MSEEDCQDCISQLNLIKEEDNSDSDDDGLPCVEYINQTQFDQ